MVTVAIGSGGTGGRFCDIVTLADENRANVYWGLEV